MSKFCGNCGAPSAGTAWCGSCGGRMGEAPSPPDGAAAPHGTSRTSEEDGRTALRPPPAGAQPANPHASPQTYPQAGTSHTPPHAGWAQPQAPAGWAPSGTVAGPGVGPGAGQWPAHQPAPRAVPTVNPFLGVPVSDYVKDAVAALCLLLAIGQPWDFHGDASDRWWAVLSLMVALLGLAVPYLMSSRLFPSLTPRQSVGIKLALAAPVVVSVLVAVLLDLLTIGDEIFGLGDEGGVGVACALALAGAGLMAQPRASEEVLGLSGERAWRTAANVAAVGAVVVGVLAFVGYVAGVLASDLGGMFGGPGEWVFVVVLTLLVPLVLTGVPAALLLARDVGGRRVLAVVAWTVVTVTLFATWDDDASTFGAAGFEPGVENWFGPTGGTFLLGLAGALLLSRSARRRTDETRDPLAGWLRTARVALAVSALVLVLQAVAIVVAMVTADEFPARAIAATLGAAAAVAAAGVAVSTATDVRQRGLVTVCAGIVVAVGLAVWIVSATADEVVGAMSTSLSPYDACAYFVLPATAIWSLWVPSPVQAAVPNRAPQGWMPPTASGPQGWPAQGQQVHGKPSGGQAAYAGQGQQSWPGQQTWPATEMGQGPVRPPSQEPQWGPPPQQPGGAASPHQPGAGSPQQ